MPYFRPREDRGQITSTQPGSISARIPELYYGAKDRDFGACGSVLNLFEENFRHHPKIVGHILEAECRKVLGRFFEKIR